jgi:hypothetical protein
MFVHGRMSETRIATALNAAGLVTDRGTPWFGDGIGSILRNEKYIGNYVWNRSSFKLRKTRVRNNPEAWIRADGAFEGIVNHSLFYAAQAIFQARSDFTGAGRPRSLSNEQMLDALRRLLKEHGYLSQGLIDQTEGMASYRMYKMRFGGILQAYSQVGYECKDPRFLRASPHYFDQEILEGLRRLLEERGRLSEKIIDEADGLPWARLYKKRFGSLFKAYELIGYTPEWRRHPERPKGLSNEEMLNRLRRLFKERGRLSTNIIRDCNYVPGECAYKIRFGSLMQAYRLIGLTGDRYSMHSSRPRDLSAKEMLTALRNLLRERGSLSQKIINACKRMPSLYQYEKRFGDLMQAYELIGFRPKPRAYGVAARNKNRASRRKHSAK